MFKKIYYKVIQYFTLENRFERISKKYQKLRKEIEEKYFSELINSIGQDIINAAVDDNSNLEFPEKAGGVFMSKEKKKKYDEYMKRLRNAEEFRKKEDEEIVATLKNKNMQKILQAIEKGDKKFELIPDIDE